MLAGPPRLGIGRELDCGMTNDPVADDCINLDGIPVGGSGG